MSTQQPREFISLGQIADDWLERRKQGNVRAYTTGFSELDGGFGKILPGTVNTIFGPSGLGKSALVFSIAMRQAAAGIDCAFFSLEMSLDLMLCRAIAIRTGIPLRELTEGRLSPRDYEIIEAELPNFRPLPIIISEERDIKQFAKLVQNEVTKGSDTVVFVDYIGLLRLGRLTGPTGYELMTVFSQNLVDLSRLLDVPFIVAAQSNREASKRNDKRPTLSDLREAGEADAAKVFGLYRESYYSKADHSPETDNLEVHILKNRNGARGKVDLQFIGPTAEVTEWTEEEKRERAWDAAGVRGNGHAGMEW